MIRVTRDEQDGVGVSVVMLARADKRNALTPTMLTGLIDAAEHAAEAGDGVVIAGEGSVFCAGFDLAMCQRSPEGAVMRLLLTGLSDACRALRGTDRPVVIAAHGAAIAGGCALLGGADVVVADRGAKLGYPVTKLGVSPAVSAAFLRHAVGDGAARERLLLPSLFDGEAGHRLGLVHELVDAREDVLPRAVEIAFELAAKPPEAYAATKRWVHRLDGVERHSEADIALEASLSLTGGDEERERLGALDFGQATRGKGES